MKYSLKAICFWAKQIALAADEKMSVRILQRCFTIDCSEKRIKMRKKLGIVLLSAAVIMAAGCSKNTQNNVNSDNTQNETTLEESSETITETQTTEDESMSGR